MRRSSRRTRCLKLRTAEPHMPLKIRELPEGAIVSVPGVEAFAVRRGARYMSTETNAHMLLQLHHLGPGGGRLRHMHLPLE